MAAGATEVRSYDFLTLGETLLRLSPPGVQRLDQARAFDVGIGGSELNVACLLARLGRRTAWVSTQPWQLARSTGATVVPAAVMRTSRQRLHRVVLAKGFQVAQTADKEADVRAAAAIFGDWFTKQLRKRPDHYLPYLLLRRRVRRSDARPFFEDWPEQGS